jgi:hypothetical protein
MMQAAREYERALVAGIAPEQSDEARAGELLAAELAADIHEIADIARAWREAHKK